jgi:hypothetical protein
MWLAVKTFVTPASLCNKRSSNPNIGAGLTIVVSGKMLRTTASPRAYSKFSSCSDAYWRRLTFVRKNSEGEFASALYDETWMNRSISYFATASAIRSAPSTCTSSRSKFLDLLVPCSGFIYWHILGGVVAADEVVYDIRMSDALL